MSHLQKSSKSRKKFYYIPTSAFEKGHWVSSAVTFLLLSQNLSKLVNLIVWIIMAVLQFVFDYKYKSVCFRNKALMLAI